MGYKELALTASALVLSSSVNASVINTLNGINYEWLELTETVGMSRVQVQTAIDAAVPGELLYGYTYASRSLVEDLLLSYAAWDQIDGYHGDPAVATGMAAYHSDFGTLSTIPGDGYNSIFNTVDGYAVLL